MPRKTWRTWGVKGSTKALAKPLPCSNGKWPSLVSLSRKLPRKQSDDGMAWSPQLFLVWNDPGRYVGIAVAKRSFDCTQGKQNVGETVFERLIGELALTLRDQRTEITPRCAVGWRRTIRGQKLKRLRAFP